MIAEITSLSALRELLARGLGDSGLNDSRLNDSGLSDSGLNDSGLSALAEALWTRIEGMQVLVETLEEMLRRLLEYHGCGVGAGLVPAQPDGATNNRAATRAAPTFKAILEATKQILRCAQNDRSEDLQTGVRGSADLRFKVRGSSSVSCTKAADLEKQVCATPQNEGSEDLQSGDGRESAGRVGAVREPPLRAEARDSGLSLEDLWIELDPFLPDTTPLDGVRGWFEAADGVRDAGVRLAQRVDVALYEFAVRRFGIRREFVAWRPPLSLNQRQERQGRPAWDVQVRTVDGEVLVKFSDGEMISGEEVVDENPQGVS